MGIILQTGLGEGRGREKAYHFHANQKWAEPSWQTPFSGQSPNKGCYGPLKSAPCTANWRLQMPSRSVLWAQWINCWAERNRLIEVVKAESLFELWCVNCERDIFFLWICKIKLAGRVGATGRKAGSRISANGGPHWNSFQHTPGCGRELSKKSHLLRHILGEEGGGSSIWKDLCRKLWGFFPLNWGGSHEMFWGWAVVTKVRQKPRDTFQHSTSQSSELCF